MNIIFVNYFIFLVVTVAFERHINNVYLVFIVFH